MSWTGLESLLDITRNNAIRFFIPYVLAKQPQGLLQGQQRDIRQTPKYNQQTKLLIRMIMGYGYRESYRELFKELKVLPFSSQNIFYLLLFVVNNKDYFVSNAVYNNISISQRSDLHLPQVTLAMHQKGVYYSGIKIFNGLPKTMKIYLQQA
jgi:hypothetical protein